MQRAPPRLERTGSSDAEQCNAQPRERRVLQRNWGNTLNAHDWRLLGACPKMGVLLGANARA
eukprot:9441863-Lingulodinium_polyedra.AAC.1